MILEENKKIYTSLADLYIPTWKTDNKNDLIRDAVACEDECKKDGYVAAIMLRYWNKIEKYYNKSKLVATPEDCHTWLVKSVMYAIEEHPWTNESSSIYGDKNGPDKVINRFMESRRVTFYQQLNRYVRKIQSEKLSLDSFIEDYSDAYMPADVDTYRFETDFYITKFFEEKEYEKAFILDTLIYYMDGRELDNVSRIIYHINRIDDEYLQSFSSRYSIDLSRVEKAYSYLSRLSYEKFKKKIKYHLLDLKYELAKDLLRR